MQTAMATQFTSVWQAEQTRRHSPTISVPGGKQLAELAELTS
jgi:hypothetical protein